MSSPLDMSSPQGSNELQAPSWWALLIGVAVAAIPLVHFGGGPAFLGGGHQHATSAAQAPALSTTPGAHTSAASPHSDHSPHHGGQLGMVGDFHIEMVERGDTIEIHLSDAERTPLPPTSGTLVFDTGTERPLAPFSTFLLAPSDKKATEVTVNMVVGTDSDEAIEMSFLLARSTKPA